MQFPIKKEIKKALGISCLHYFLQRTLTLWVLMLTIVEGVSEALREHHIPQPALFLAGMTHSCRLITMHSNVKTIGY